MSEKVSNRQQNASLAARTNGWAIAALVCSLFVLCPPVMLLGVPFAIRALVQIKSDPSRKGRGLAIAGLIISLLTFTTVGYFAQWWHVRFRNPMLQGPITSLESGFEGDLIGFREGFFEESQPPTDAEISEFLGELTSRYGSLESIHQRDGAGEAALGYQMRSYRITYEMVFESGPINAEGRFIITAPNHQGFVGRFAWFAVFDDENGDLIYPASAAEELRNAEPTADAKSDEN